jgi:NitT/TauT family transport system substrate-binding protein
MADKLARFLKASLKGWDYAIKHQEEAVKIVLDNDASGAQTKQHQTTQMLEIAKLVEGSKLGFLEPKSYDRTVTTLMTGKSDPVISKKPQGAWTHKIWDMAQK